MNVVKWVLKSSKRMQIPNISKWVLACPDGSPCLKGRAYAFENVGWHDCYLRKCGFNMESFA
jgi:hypothetical protein